MASGICLHQNGSVACIATPYGTSVETINSTFSLDLPGSHVNLTVALSNALQLQKNVFFSFETFAASTFFTSVLLLVIRIYVKNE
jgi:hypothetical protein